jgi:tetratricopeptide (TPR) repeat protein
MIDKSKLKDNALRFIQKGQPRKAIKAYDKILAEHPGDCDVLVKKGELLVKTNEKSQAIDTFLQAATIHSQQREHAKSLALLKRCWELDRTRDDIQSWITREERKMNQSMS